MAEFEIIVEKHVKNKTMTLDQAIEIIAIGLVWEEAFQLQASPLQEETIKLFKLVTEMLLVAG